MISKCNDGHGGESFYHQLADENDLDKIMSDILARGRDETLPDQWEGQILVRILQKATVIFVSDAPDKMISDMHMIPAHNLDEALKLAKEILKNEKPTITAIPDGISVMVVDN